MLISAFGCAGQRCSALRVAYLQDEVYDTVFKQLTGAMKELNVDNPLKFSTDIGPLITTEATSKIKSYIEKMKSKGFTIVSQGRHDNLNSEQRFVLPTVIEVNNLSDVSEEIFGPVLHVIKYHIKELDDIMQQINHSGYGLTFGIHSRIPSRMEKLSRQVFLVMSILTVIWWGLLWVYSHLEVKECLELDRKPVVQII